MTITPEKTDRPGRKRSGGPPGGPGRTGVSRGRVAGFVALCVACVAVGVGYVIHTGGRDGRKTDAATSVAAGAPTAASLMAGPHLLVRDMAAGNAGFAGVLALSDPGGPRAVTDLPCARLYMAAGNGICLSDHGDILNPYKVVFFGPDFKPRATGNLQGVPSRARVSADGKYGTSTVFVTGDSYAAGSFSTRTTIWDMATGNALLNLEDFTVWKNGQQLQSPDHNFWGVTFDPKDSNHFWATLGTKGHTYLVEGHVSDRKVEVLRDGVECPSISPDGTRIAFKQRTSAGGADAPTWRLAVLDLATLADHPLAETHDIDDQAEWLDNSTVTYAVDTGVGAPSTWAVPADGSGAPRLLVADADSPSVAR
ncbi:MAG TPA: hypothetical protein VHL53_10570 [Acidimicrobiia bacterium]|nr:hypothetical protein [Acidimicrobiia bacterium]